MKRFLVSALLACATVSASSAQDSSDTSTKLRVHISIDQRRLWVLDESGDTLRSALVSVGSGRTLRTAERSWTFATPLGEATVTAKEANPAWVPPDWHYVEIAQKLRLDVGRVEFGTSVRLRDGSQLVIRDRAVGLLAPDSTFRLLPTDEEIIVDGTLYIPPFGTRNRRLSGVLGSYRLLLSNGVGLHGTPYAESIGKAATHGCIRLLDDDIAWLYRHVPVGAEVVIFP
jgi:hypothetical protein